MGQYTPPFQITNQMLNDVSSISEKIGKINQLNNSKTQLHLRKNNRIQSIHSSLHIEANSLSLQDVRDVINDKLVIGPKKDIQEVKNAYAAYEMIDVINPYCLDDLHKIHGMMTSQLLYDSGQFRKGDEGVFEGERCIFMAPPPQYVEQLMTQLFDWLESSKDIIHPLILSSIFHYEFVLIHPYSDGNGRMARLWHNVLLYQWNPVFAFIPIESQIEKFQSGYYQAIASCHNAGSSNEFIEFMLKQIDHVLDDMLFTMQDHQNHLSIYVKKLLHVMEYNIPYTAKEIMDMLHLKSRDTLRNNYLNPAIELHLIEMTIPDKPQSKNQRYVKK